MSHLVARIHRETRLAPGSIVQIVGIVLNYTLTARQLEQARPAYPWEQQQTGTPIETPEAPE